MGSFRTSRVFDVIFVLVLAALIGLAWVNRVAISDRMFFLTYHPSPEAAQVAADAGLSSFGRTLFYRTNPQFVSRAEVAAACDLELLGCINARGEVFIADIPGKHDAAVVTAAHEMLHLAYRRLSQAQKDALAPDIDKAVAINAAGIKPELSAETTDDDRRDEAHSLLGTEYENLPSALEKYYSKYFADRHKILAAEAASERE